MCVCVQLTDNHGDCAPGCWMLHPSGRLKAYAGRSEARGLAKSASVLGRKRICLLSSNAGALHCANRADSASQAEKQLRKATKAEAISNVSISVLTLQLCLDHTFEFESNLTKGSDERRAGRGTRREPRERSPAHARNASLMESPSSTALRETPNAASFTLWRTRSAGSK